MLQLLCVAICVLPLFYLYLTWHYNHWRNKGVVQADPLPGIGNYLDILLHKKSTPYIYTDLYRAFPNAPAVGFYDLRTPALLIRDPEIIRTVLVKDFSSFHDIPMGEGDSEAYIYRDPFLSKGQHWKVNRNTLVPILNLAKLKSIYPQMKEIAKELQQYIDNNLGKDVEAKNLAFMFTTDVVSNCAFGISGNSFKETEAVFKHMGKLMVDKINGFYRAFAMMHWPKLATKFNIRAVGDDVGKYLESVVMETQKHRAKNNITRNDILDHILNLKGKKKINGVNEEVYENVDVVGYALTFFVEGFETSAITASFALYELAKHPNIQNRLRDEIQMAANKMEDLDYDGLHGFKYLDQVISETLRRYPVIFSMFRVCTKNTTLEIDGRNVKIEKGTLIAIPVYGIQHDPNYYPKPEVFDPERFSEENIASRPSYTYLPFGEGPRICIGMRFGLTQVKLMLAALVLNYNITCSKNLGKIEFDETCMVTSCLTSLLLNFQKIK
uniref:Cytochrome P450 n=1 Tax=Clastoptera arizonana TaxID=38151 RepID=A0A1B6CY50_9HEMI